MMQSQSKFHILVFGGEAFESMGKVLLSDISEGDGGKISSAQGMWGFLACTHFFSSMSYFTFPLTTAVLPSFPAILSFLCLSIPVLTW